MDSETQALAVAATELLAWLQQQRSLVVLSGAGISTGSGIPDYRDADGQWKRPAPIEHADFVRHAVTRQRYWARSFMGWPHFSAARPNAAHRALATLEQHGLVDLIITQNVDRLHQRAGSGNVIDLHGRLDRVACLTCERDIARQQWQQELQTLNPDWQVQVLRMAPDGDADLHEADYQRFRVPPCSKCGGVMKPGVIFYGGTLNPTVRTAAREAAAGTPALLVVGSSLMVASAHTLVRSAAEHGAALAAINQGRTRTDALFGHKWSTDCSTLLAATADLLDGS